jgi:hypothetical protein
MVTCCMPGRWWCGGTRTVLLLSDNARARCRLLLDTRRASVWDVRPFSRSDGGATTAHDVRVGVSTMATRIPQHKRVGSSCAHNHCTRLICNISSSSSSSELGSRRCWACGGDGAARRNARGSRGVSEGRGRSRTSVGWAGSAARTGRHHRRVEGSTRELFSSASV